MFIYLEWTSCSLNIGEMAGVFARTAQRLDAEYDGGNSDCGEDDSEGGDSDSQMKLDTAAAR